MKKKFILVIVMLILCCGCQANYKVTINEDLTVQEDVMATRDADFFAEYENSSMGRVVSLILNPYLDTLNEKKYTVNNYITSSRGGVVINKKYDSLEDYADNTIFASQFTDEIKYSKNGDEITLRAKGNFSHAEQDQTRFPITEAKISITVPYKVIEHNADKVDDNTYIWTINNDEEHEIKLVFDKSKIEKDVNYATIIVVVGLIALLIIGFVVYSKFRTTRENVNKV